MDLFRQLNVKPSSRHLSVTFDGPVNIAGQQQWSREKRSLRQALSLAHHLGDMVDMARILCPVYIDDFKSLRYQVEQYKPPSICFFDKMIESCQLFL